MLIYALGATALLLAGADKAERAPSGPTAQINFLANPNGGRNGPETLTLYGDTRCGRDFHGKTIGRHGFFGPTKGPITIPAGARIMIAVTGPDITSFSRYASCMTHARFTPEPGHVYDVRHTTLPGTCILDVRDHATGESAPGMVEVPRGCDKVD